MLVSLHFLYGEIWLHWKEQNTHHMQVFFWFSFRGQAVVQAAIDIIANIIKYALGPRLQKIRAVGLPLVTL